MKWRDKHFGQLNENASVKMSNGLSIFDYALDASKADEPVCGSMATIVMNAMRVIGHDRQFTSNGFPQRVSYSTISGYHANFRVKVPVQNFVRLCQVADGEMIKLMVEGRK